MTNFEYIANMDFEEEAEYLKSSFDTECPAPVLFAIREYNLGELAIFLAFCTDSRRQDMARWLLETRETV